MNQPILPLGGDIEREVRRIELDAMLSEIEPLLERITTGPWIADSMKNVGDNWLIASFGADENQREWILTTDRVRASEVGNCDAEADARFCALSRRLMPLLIEELRGRR